MTAPDVIATFARLTATPLRIASADQRAQAIAFVEAGFSLEELEMVIRFTQKEQKKDRATLNKFSCSWVVLFGRYGGGNEFQTFQERLGMAMKERDARKPRAENIVPVTRTVDGNGSTITVLDCKPFSDSTEETSKLVAEQLAAFRKSMNT